MSKNLHLAGGWQMSRRGALAGTAAVAGGALLASGAQFATARPAAAAAQPTIATRSDWGARAPSSAVNVLDAPPDQIVVHHTATGNSTDYSQSHAFSLSRGIQNFHMDDNGWIDAGQQLTISRGGFIMEGRHRSLEAINANNHVVGAHVANHNSHTIGIENEGTYTSVTPTTDLYNSLVDTCAWLCAAYSLNPQSAIVGHRDFNPTECPGDELYAMLPALRDDVEATLNMDAVPSARQHWQGLPSAHRPTYPDVPSDESTAPFRHGPALGARDPNSG